MGFINDLASGVKNSLRWQAQSAVTGGLSTGIRTVIKGLKNNKCPKCGKSIKEEATTFCTNCGASMVLFCQNTSCGRQAPLGTKFCPTCGSKLQDTKPAEIKQEVNPPASQ